MPRTKKHKQSEAETVESVRSEPLVIDKTDTPDDPPQSTDPPPNDDSNMKTDDTSPENTEDSPKEDIVAENTPTEDTPIEETPAVEIPHEDIPETPPTDDSPEKDRPTVSSKDNKPDESEPEINTPVVLEAVLFAADEPVTPNKLAEIVGTGGVREIRKHVEALNKKYEKTDCAFRIEAIAGGYQMLTRPDFNPWLKKLIKVRSESKLSPAALETLAIVAYKQPILRVDIESIRGVAAGEMVRQLIEKGLVKIVGRAEEIGRPLLYGTTKKFLEVFGLNNLKDLPTAEDLKKPKDG